MLLAGFGTGQAEIATMAPSSDAWIISELPNNNMGAAGDFAAGVNAHGSPMRALIRFDLSEIPANAEVTSVILTVSAVHQHFLADEATFALHRLLQDWGEGSGSGNTGSPATSGQATWNARFHSAANWVTAGASASSDRSAVASASVLVNGLGDYTLGSTPAMVADVQQWVNNPGSNFGWLFKDQAESTVYSARRWSSRESGSGPSLVVTYSVPSAAPGLVGAARTNNEVTFSFNAAANRSYTVEARSALGAGPWSPVTNFTALTVATNVVVTDAISPGHKFYRVVSP